MDYYNEQDRLIALLTDELPVLRARLKISQDELSRRIGISRQTYSLIETKKQKISWLRPQGSNWLGMRNISQPA